MSIQRPAALNASSRTGKIDLKIVQKRVCRYGWILALLTLFSGCVHVPMSSETIITDKLRAIPSVEPGDVLLVYGENAAVPEQSIIGSYLTAYCLAAFHGNTVGELIKTILKVNPQPGRFAVRHLKELEREGDADSTSTEGNSILSRLNLSKARVLKDRLRYAVHVREEFGVTVHVPLYFSPFGVASCGNRTVLEAHIWELPTEKFLGSLSVSAKGEFTVVAYLLHFVVSRDTQKDATWKLARAIVERLTGLKPLENQVD